MRTSGETPRNEQKQPPDRAPRHASWAAQLGDTQDPKGETPADATPAPDPPGLCSAPRNPAPLAPWEGKESAPSARERSPPHLA